MTTPADKRIAKIAEDAADDSQGLTREFDAAIRAALADPVILASVRDAALQDAERYRKLRYHHLQTGPDSWIRTGDDLDEATDALPPAPKG